MRGENSMFEPKDEYLMLRDEILHLDTIVSNTITFFYAFIASFLAFALTQTDNVLFILSYIVIFPAYLIVLSRLEGIYRIGAYLKVFHEGETFMWETRNSKFVKARGKKYFSYFVFSSFPFIVVNIAVLLLFFYKTDFKALADFEFYEIIKIVLMVILFVAFLFVFFKNRKVSTEDYFQGWEALK